MDSKDSKFNKSKFTKMIAYSIVQKSQLEGESRIDAEYFIADQVLKNFYFGGEVISFVQYGTSDDLNESKVGFPTLRLNEFDDYFIKEPEKYCATLSNMEFKSLELKQNDLLICRTNGNPLLVGKSALVMENRPYAFASYLFRVRTNQKINSSTLLTYLHSTYGRAEIEKNEMISNQTNFSPARFKLIRIPKFDKKLQSKIELIIQKSYELSKKSLTNYQQAENLLLEELELKDFQAPEDLSCVVDYLDVKKVDRVDADYFQPKYEKLVIILKKQKMKKFSEIIEDVLARFVPRPDGNYKYVELANINSSIGVVDGYSEVLGKEAPSRARRLLKTGDVLVSSIQGSLGKTALVGVDQDESLASTGFFQFRSTEILPEVLLILAKSVVLQWQLERECAGTILSAVPQESLKRLIIPVLPKLTQQKIADLVRRSHGARKKSKALHEEAKRKVEEIIEHGGKK